jgi:TRAP-type transport system periplasmic protein
MGEELSDQIGQFRALDANPVSICLHELYTSLRRKVVEALEKDINTIHDTKFYEGQKYMTLSNFAWKGYAFAVSKAFLSSRTPNCKRLGSKRLRRQPRLIAME